MGAPAYDFQDWFSNNIPNWTHWLAHLKGTPAYAIEVGSCEGRSAVWLLENILSHAEAFLACVDIELRERLIENVGAIGARERVATYGMPSSQFWGDYPQLGLSPCADLVYIDGSHHARDVLEDSVRAWPVLKPGGILIWDDYLWGPEDDPTASEWDRPGPAIDTFLSAYRREARTAHRVTARH